MKISGIYRIQSRLKPGSIYIGSTSNIKQRWKLHLSELKRNIHKNNKLQNHFNKYGEDDLIFIIIEPCFPQFLIDREQYYIDSLKPFFNICLRANNTFGVKRSKETRKKISDAVRLRVISEETKKKMSERMKGNQWNLGRKLTDEHKEKIGKSGGKNKGYKFSQSWKNNLSKSHIGKSLTKEQKMKISNSNKERWIKRKSLKIS